ncbi:MAG: hypothetical protein AB7E49_02440 [Campylobacterales bacterium]
MGNSFLRSLFILCLAWSGLLAETLHESIARFKSYSTSINSNIRPGDALPLIGSDTNVSWLGRVVDFEVQRNDDEISLDFYCVYIPVLGFEGNDVRVGKEKGELFLLSLRTQQLDVSQISYMQAEIAEKPHYMLIVGIPAHVRLYKGEQVVQIAAFWASIRDDFLTSILPN